MTFDSKKKAHFNQELLIQTIQKRIARSYKSLAYKGVSVTHIMCVYIYWKAIANSEISQKPDDKTIINHVNLTVDDLFIRSKLSKRKFYLKFKKDIKNWLLSYKNKEKSSLQLDYLINIEAEKYYNFIKPIAQQLVDKGFKVGFLIYSNIQVKESEDFFYINYESFKTHSFPKFWKKTYLNAYYSYQLIESVYSVYKRLNFPKTILVEGDNATQIIVGYLSKKYNFKSICIQWGYAGGTSVYKLGWRNMPYSSLLTWGDFFTNSFRKQNKDLNIITSGHPLMNELPEEQNHIKDVILFAIPKEMPPYVIKKDVIEFIKKAIDFCNENTSYKVRFRTHPNFNFDKELSKGLRNINDIELHNYFTHSLATSFLNVKYCISVGSTISLESINYGCIPVFMQMNDIPLLIYSELKNILNYPFVIKKQERIKEALNNIADFNISVNYFRNYFFINKKENLIINHIVND